jgi:hypothetical protein
LDSGVSCCSDLLSKKFDFDDLKLTIKRKTACGLAVDTSATASGGALSGSVKLVYKEKGLGDFELSDNTNGKLKAKAKLTNLQKGVVVTIEPAVTTKLSLNTTVDYSQDNFALTAGLNLTEVPAVAASDEKKAVPASVASAFNVAAVVGFEGISLGGKVTGNLSDGSSPDVNMGLNFAEDDFQFSLITETGESGPIVKAKFNQQVNADLQSGFEFSNPDNTLTLGSQYRLDSATLFKSTISTSGIIKTAIQHTLANPRAQVNLASEFSTTNGFDLSANQYGLSVTLGDF